MRLPFCAPPAPDPRQVVEAQWALVGEIEQTVASSYVPADCQARRMAEELLRAVRGIVEHIDIQRDFTRRLGEGIHKPFEEPFLQSQEILRGDAILEP